MKTIGLIGGMSWESTIVYYQIINKEVQKRLGGLYSAEILMESYNFDEIAALQKADEWDKLNDILTTSAQKLEKAGADVVLIATNTMHKCAPYVQSKINIPLLHIVDTTSREILRRGYKKVGLLGTKYTMSQEFYRDKLRSYGIESIIPGEDGQCCVHGVIFDELCAGKILDDSRKKLNKIIDCLTEQGAEAVILGCTELPNIIKTASVPIVDTMELHALGAVDFALEKKS